MINQIGFLSNDICNLIMDCGEVSVLTLKSKLKTSNTLIYLALGWLLREGKVYIRKDKDDYLVGLSR